MKIKMKLEYSDKTPCFELESLFKHHWIIFFILLKFSKHLKGNIKLVLWLSQKHRDQTTDQWDHIAGKAKIIEIFKKWRSKWDWNILTNLMFRVENFFQGPLKNFLGTFRTCSGYLEGPSNIAQYDRKKIRCIACVAEKISTKRLGGG